MHDKYDKLIEYLKGLGSVTVAFSGGVDSVFLLRAAKEALGDKVLAVTLASCLFPKRELNEAISFCKDNGIKQIIYEADELSIEGFSENPTNRCYLCKKDLFKQIIKISEENGMNAVAEGSNMDDNGDYRPGLVAVAELNVKSPLRSAELYKNEIRALSKEMGLPTWNRPSFACLASRFVYGETITKERLKMVENAEQLLFDMGVHQVRVRVHGENKGVIARIEVNNDEMNIIMDDSNRSIIQTRFKELGFSYVTLDLSGFRSGSMNDLILKEGES